jgi:transglutaminase-like putative cysteine protease
MLESGNLRGKCADINALFVGLARAAGLPARDLYGIRVAPSHAFESLGRGGGDVTTAQHRRAEVFAEPVGWIPVDPADVRKLLLEEPGVTGLDHPKARAAERRLFGSWEGHWMAYNDAHDLRLPGSDGAVLLFLMYPQAEIGRSRRDSLAPERFRYSITARELD